MGMISADPYITRTTVKKALEKAGEGMTDEEREHLRSLRVSAAQRFLSLRAVGIEPHGKGKRKSNKEVRNRMAKRSRRNNRGR